MTNKRKKITLDEIIGTIDIPPVEGRFQEILSTQKILDTETNIQYDGLVDREFLELVNEIFEEKEKYIFNKYLLSHLIKNSWYSIICFTIVLIRFVIKLHFSRCFIYIIILLCISILTSLFQRKFSKHLEWKYSKGYSEYAVNYTKIVSGGLAVLLSFFPI